jgi:type IV pilus assembly protein PilE
MIVVVIIAILTAIAIPSYQAYVVRAARAEAKGVLLDAAGFMQRYFNSTNTYVGATLPTSLQYSPTTSVAATAKYNMSISNLAATTFTLSAAPTTLITDNDCGTLSVDQLGKKSSSKGTVATCWAR